MFQPGRRGSVTVCRTRLHTAAAMSHVPERTLRHLYGAGPFLKPTRRETDDGRSTTPWQVVCAACPHPPYLFQEGLLLEVVSFNQQPVQIRNNLLPF